MQKLFDSGLPIKIVHLGSNFLFSKQNTYLVFQVPIVERLKEVRETFYNQVRFGVLLGDSESKISKTIELCYF